jgi:competence protein ComEC
LKLRDYPGSFQVFYYHKKNISYPRFSYGDEVRVSGRFEIPWTFEDFDYRSWLWTRDIWGIVSVWSAKEIKRLKSDQGNPLLAWGYRTQLALFGRMDEYLGLPESSLLKSLLFGEQAYLSPNVREDFRDAGVMHVLAVSGMNLGMIVSLFWFLLRTLRLSVSSIYLILLPVALAFLTLAGFQVSLVRATLAFAFIALGSVLAERGWILRRWADPLQGLAAAALIILIVSPKALFDVSFQLSFAATAGILIALDWIMPRWKPYRRELQQRWHITDALWKRGLFWSVEAIFFALIISLAAQLAVAPLLASQFHRVYLSALLSNLVVIPLVTLTTWAGMAFLTFATIQLASLATASAVILSTLLGALIALTGFMADFPGAYFPIGRDAWLNLLVLLPLLLSPLAWRTGQLALARLRLN